MGSNKPHARGKPQRREKIKPVIQHNTQPRPTTIGTPHAAPAEQAPQTVVTVPPIPMSEDVTGAVVPVGASPMPVPLVVEEVASPAAPASLAPAPDPIPEKMTEVLSEPSNIPRAVVAHAPSDPVPMRHGGQRTPTPPSELTPMFTELRELFTRDRAFASRQDTARCGICFLTFTRDQLVFRETDGFYACPPCDASLGHHHLPMLRRQRK